MSHPLRTPVREAKGVAVASTELEVGSDSAGEGEHRLVEVYADDRPGGFDQLDGGARGDPVA
jgi:hypothetical protein